MRYECIAVIVPLLIAESCVAQELRVYTQVYDKSAVKDSDAAQPPIISRSLTLFHAGKVYDYVPSVGELIILEPAHRRFTIVNGSRMLAVRVAFDEMERLLQIAKRESLRELDRLSQHADTKSAKHMEKLRFELQPRFEERFDEKSRRLTLTSDQFNYVVECGTADSSDVVERYLQYADWAARINYVLHPYAYNPNIRLALNKRLRGRGLMPVNVELRSSFEHPVHLHAHHKIHWNLDAKDRQDIHHWESLLKHKDMRRVSFRAYQEAMLISQSK